MARGISQTARQYLEGQPALFRPIVESLIVAAEDAKRSEADFNGADGGAPGFSVLPSGGALLAGVESDVLEFVEGTALYDLNGNQPGATPFVSVTTYSGVSFTAQTTLLYVVRVMKAGIGALKFRKMTLNEPLLSNSVGEAEVVAAINPQLAALANAPRSHFNPGTSLVNNVPTTLP